MVGTKHKELQDTAIRWLYDNGCDIFAKECPIMSGDVADAIGVKQGMGKQYATPDRRFQSYYEVVVYFIEAKATRADLICPKQRRSYARSLSEPFCDMYYLIVADGVTVEDDLYPSWGVLSEDGRVVRRAKKLAPQHASDQGWRRDIIRMIAHSLVYRVFGRLYDNR